MTDLRDAVASAVPVVRGLDWSPVEGRMCMGAATAFGEYIAYKSGAWSGPASPYTETDGSMDDAKAACQADFERRSREIINPDFLSALDTARAEIERLHRLEKLVCVFLDNNPDELVADSGETVLDLFRYQARATLSPVKETTDV